MGCNCNRTNHSRTTITNNYNNIHSNQQNRSANNNVSRPNSRTAFANINRNRR